MSLQVVQAQSVCVCVCVCVFEEGKKRKGHDGFKRDVIECEDNANNDEESEEEEKKVR